MKQSILWCLFLPSLQITRIVSEKTLPEFSIITYNPVVYNKYTRVPSIFILILQKCYCLGVTWQSTSFPFVHLFIYLLFIHLFISLFLEKSWSTKYVLTLAATEYSIFLISFLRIKMTTSNWSVCLRENAIAVRSI